MRKYVVPMVAAVLAMTIAIAGCGSDDDDGPPPTLGGATVVEQPDGTTP